jgi:hypothetical protein
MLRSQANCITGVGCGIGNGSKFLMMNLIRRDNCKKVKVSSGVLELTILLLILIVNPTKGQHDRPTLAGIIEDMYYQPNRSILVDPDTLDYPGYLSFLEVILDSDQKYRRILAKLEGSSDKVKVRSVEKSMKRNDRENQAILLALLKKFGWPCSKDRNHSLSAWLVVWHADHLDKPPFYPFVKEANSRGCIMKGHYEQLGL